MTFLKKILLPFLILAAVMPAAAQTSKTGRVDVGLLASRPAACSAGDLYVASDVPQQYVCGPANTWTAAGAGAQLGTDNIFTNANRFKGPIPQIDFTAFMPPGGCSAVNNFIQTTGTISMGSPNLSVGATIFQNNGCGIMVTGAGPASSLSVPNGSPASVISSCTENGGNTLLICVMTGFTDALPGQTFVISGNSNASINGTYTTATPVYSAQNDQMLSLTATIGAGMTGTGGTATPNMFGIVHGPAASTTYNYKVVAFDQNEGYSAASAQFPVTNGPSVLTKDNFILINCGSVSNAVGYVLYRNGVPVAVSYLQCAFEDMGFTMSIPDFIPNSPPGSNGNQALFTTIVSGAPSGSLVLAANASNSVSSVNVYLDNSSFLESAETYALSKGPYNIYPTVVIPYGNYPIARIRWPGGFATPVKQIGAVTLINLPIFLTSSLGTTTWTGVGSQSNGQFTEEMGAPVNDLYSNAAFVMNSGAVHSVSINDAFFFPIQVLADTNHQDRAVTITDSLLDSNGSGSALFIEAACVDCYFYSNGYNTGGESHPSTGMAGIYMTSLHSTNFWGGPNYFTGINMDYHGFKWDFPSGTGGGGSWTGNHIVNMLIESNTDKGAFVVDEGYTTWDGLQFGNAEITNFGDDAETGELCRFYAQGTNASIAPHGISSNSVLTFCGQVQQLSGVLGSTLYNSAQAQNGGTGVGALGTGSRLLPPIDGNVLLDTPQIEAGAIGIKGAALGPTANAGFYAAFPAPLNPITLTLQSGGSLSASQTYCYQISLAGLNMVTSGIGGVTHVGETEGSNEVCATTSSSNKKILISWNFVNSVGGYLGFKVYRGTSAGAENVLINPGSTGYTVTAGNYTYTDDGTATTTTETVPTINNAYYFFVPNQTGNPMYMQLPSGSTVGIGTTCVDASTNSCITDGVKLDVKGGYIRAQGGIIDGNVTGSTQCLHADSTGHITGAGFDCSNSGATAFSGLTASTNSNSGTFAASGNTWDFHSATAFLLPGSLSTGLVRVTTSTGALGSAELSGDATTSGSNAVTVTKINGTSLAGLATGILKNTTGTGLPSIAVAGDFPTLNQSTTGNAATATALASTPSLCTTGQAPTGILANGNATGCASITPASFSAITAGTNSNSGTFAASGNIWDYHLASHTLPVKSGAFASIPATCTVSEVYFATDATAGQNFYYCTSSNVFTQQLNSGAAGASTALGNLAAVAINTTLLPASVNTVALGSASLPFTNVFLGTVASQAASFSTSSLTANRTINIPDATSTPVRACTPGTNQFMTAIAVATGTCTTVNIVASATMPYAYAADSGSGTAYVVTLTPAVASYTAGLEVDFLPANANSGTTPTLNVNGVGTATITKFGTSALVANDLITTEIAKVIYDGTNWQLQNPATVANVVTASSSNTFTNKIYNAESTGNALSEPVKAFFKAAVCGASSTAGPALDLGASNQPTAQCTGSTVSKGVLKFARGNVAYINYYLPVDWNSSASTDIQACFTTTDTTNAHVTSFNIQTGFNKVDGTVTDDPSLNGAQALSVTTGASQVSGGELCGSLTSMTMTGGTAGYNMEIAVTRNNSGTDTNTDTGVALKELVLTYGVTKNASNR